MPIVLIDALSRTSVSELHVASNNCGTDGWGLGILLEQHRIARVVASYIGENKEFGRQYLAGELEVELTPQGTLAERLRAAGSGVPAFYTPAGRRHLGRRRGDALALRRRRVGGGVVAAEGGPRVRGGPGRRHDREDPLRPRALAGLRLRAGARARRATGTATSCSTAPRATSTRSRAMAGRTTIAEVEELVEPGEIDPDDVHVPGIFVHRVVELTAEQVANKHIEKRTTQKT